MTFDSINEVYPMYSDKLCLLNNGYDFKEIKIKSEQSIENNFEEDSLLFIGRVEKAKGIIELLDLFLEIVKVYPNKKVVFTWDRRIRFLREGFYY